MRKINSFPPGTYSVFILGFSTLSAIFCSSTQCPPDSFTSRHTQVSQSDHKLLYDHVVQDHTSYHLTIPHLYIRDDLYTEQLMASFGSSTHEPGAECRV